ncbi:MAG: hypothetical protein AAFQ12_02090 [Pseudomonadota bacterium]
MTQRIVTTCAALAMIAGCASAQETPSTPGWLDKDFAELVDLFDGHWDSDRHVFFAEDAGMDMNKIAPRQHIAITRLAETDDATGAVVFKAERTVEGEAPGVLHHAFSIDAANQVIVQNMAVPNESGANVSLDCLVEWKRHGAQFQGVGKGEGCDDLFPRPDAEGALSVTMSLSEADYWVTAQRGDSSIEARLRRARPFECWTAILRGASHGDSGEGMRDWDFRRGVKLHDQGGEAELVTDEETPRRVRLRLRNVDWPYGINRPSLTLYIMEGDSDRAVSYAWNEGNAERIGINLRWLQASCTHTPE